MYQKPVEASYTINIPLFDNNYLPGLIPTPSQTLLDQSDTIPTSIILTQTNDYGQSYLSSQSWPFICKFSLSYKYLTGVDVTTVSCNASDAL